MPQRKDKAEKVTAVADNPYATPEPGLRTRERRVPTEKFIVPPASTVPVLRANGHVLTKRGWVREEGKSHG